MFPEDVEKDDYLHNPDGLDGKDCDILTKRGLMNLGGLAFITIGVLALFVGYPVMYASFCFFLFASSAKFWGTARTFSARSTRRQGRARWIPFAYLRKCRSLRMSDEA